MTVTLNISDKNEGTAAPWWVFVDPKQMMKPDPYAVMVGMITGPYFSREEATAYFNAHRHNFSERAVVYCASGCYSNQYYTACKKAEDLGV